MLKLKGSHKGSSRNLNINPDHVTLCFNRQDRVILRLIDGVEIPLDDDYKKASEVRKLIEKAREKANTVHFNPANIAQIAKLMQSLEEGSSVPEEEEDPEEEEEGDDNDGEKTEED
jgi:hypothetical protein